MIHVRGNNLYPGAIEAIIRRFPEVAEYRIVGGPHRPAGRPADRGRAAPAGDGRELAEAVSRAVRDELLFRVEVARRRARHPAAVRDEGPPRRAFEVTQQTASSTRSFRCCPLCRYDYPPLALLAGLTASAAQGADWIHWRGPNQNGHSLETGLPDSFDLAKKENVVYAAPYGGRSN